MLAFLKKLFGGHRRSATVPALAPESPVRSTAASPALAPPPPPPPPPPPAPLKASASPSFLEEAGGPVRLIMEDGTMTSPSLDPELEERLRYIVDNIVGPPGDNAE